MKEIQLNFVEPVLKSLKEKEPFIQVILGPRQVGKTTGVHQIIEKYGKKKCLYVSADGLVSKSEGWLTEQWVKASENSRVLVIDEIQKVEQWSEQIKMHWDQNKKEANPIHLILLGSSSLGIQKGLNESLAGRFRIHQVYHWSFEESREAFGFNLDHYLKFGGYPGSYPLTKNVVQWLNYIDNSIIEAVIGKDILTLAKVKSPALFKQAFDIISRYPSQEISYTKLLGQLQNKGNTDQIKYYLELFEGAFLFRQLFQFSNRSVISRSSSPKILPLCPALFSATIHSDFDANDLGRAFEAAVGSALSRLPGNLYYWREKNKEVDFIYQFGKKITAIEVKYSERKSGLQGLHYFAKKHPNIKLRLITPDNFENLSKIIHDPA